MPGASAMVRSNTSRCRPGSRSRSLSGSTTRARSQSLVEERQGRVVPVRPEGAHRVAVAAEVGPGLAQPDHRVARAGERVVEVEHHAPDRRCGRDRGHAGTLAGLPVRPDEDIQSDRPGVPSARWVPAPPPRPPARPSRRGRRAGRFPRGRPRRRPARTARPGHGPPTPSARLSVWCATRRNVPPGARAAAASRCTCRRSAAASLEEGEHGQVGAGGQAATTT